MFGQRDAYFSHCLFSRDPWANVSNRAVLLVFVLVHAFLICCFFLANRGVLLALVCSLPSLQGGFAFFGFALVAPRGLLFVIPERTFRIAVFWCFSKMLFFGPGATKCRIGNVKKTTMQDARAGAPNKKGYARAGAQGKPDAPGQRKKATRNAHAGMPTKEKGKALTWMNEKKAKRTLRDCQNESNKAKRNATPGCKKRKNAAMRNVRPGATRTKRKGILGHANKRHLRPGKQKHKNAAIRNARPREKQTRNTRETPGPGRQRTQGTGTEKFAPRGWKWALGILTPQPSKNKAHI